MTARPAPESHAEIIWPVDAFQCDQEMLKRVSIALSRAFGTKVPRVRPVYLLTPNATPLPLSWFEDAWPSLQKDAEEHLDQVLAKSPFPVTDATILVVRDDHMEVALEKLNAFVRREKARLVVMPTRGREGLARFMLGSFAESMLLYSQTPLLTVNPGIKRQARHKHRCLVPVDLSTDDPQGTVDAILKSLGRKDGEIIFFHVMPPSLTRSRWSDKSIFPHSRELIASQLDKEQDRCQEIATQLVARAKRAGFKAKTVLSHSRHPVPKAIVAAAVAEAVDLIAMASESRRSGLVFAGSVTRKVVRMSPCPVWALAHNLRA